MTLETVMLRIVYVVSFIHAECRKLTHCDECRYAECHYTECRGALWKYWKQQQQKKVRQTFVKADLCRSGPLSKRTFVEADLCRRGPLSKRTFVETDLCQNRPLSKRTFVEANIGQQ
jgi:hypothetical protein